jgi:transcriptional regulator with XRE-family HTH domain
MSRQPITEHDFTLAEQASLRNALYFARAKMGSWRRLAQVLHYEDKHVSQIASGLRNVTPTVALRVAKLLNVPVEALATGRFPPPGTCPRCGFCVPLDNEFRKTATARSGKRATAAANEETP